MNPPALFHQISFILLSSIGGWLLSLTHLSIGWMIGTLSLAAFLSFSRPSFIKMPNQSKGLPKYWLNIGQCLLGIQLGQQLSLSTVSIFKDHWAVIIIMLLVSIVFSLLSGYVIWKFSRLDMLSSFFASAPGGLSSIPGIADDAGANTGVVSIIQTMRVFLVVFTIPLVVANLMTESASAIHHHPAVVTEIKLENILWTIVLIMIALLGYLIGKYFKFPAPWLIGSMMGVAVVEVFISFFSESTIVAWWPQNLIIFSQIFIAASVGSRLHKRMFSKLKGTLTVGMLSTFGMILAMILAAYFVSKTTNITFMTAVLAFAPGGIAEMATTAVVLHADATFVLSVQVLRVVAVTSLLPLFFKLLQHLEIRNDTDNRS